MQADEFRSPPMGFYVWVRSSLFPSTTFLIEYAEQALWGLEKGVSFSEAPLAASQSLRVAWLRSLLVVGQEARLWMAGVTAVLGCDSRCNGTLGHWHSGGQQAWHVPASG